MKCLVTGGAGFIGSHIAEGIAKQGATVRIFDNLSTGSKSNFDHYKDRVDFCLGDLRNPKDLSAAFKGIDVVFHQAALRSVPRSVDDPTASNDVNTNGTLNVLMAARSAGVKRVVYASSSSVYGDGKIFPQVETLRTAPISPYAVSKLAGENYCRVFSITFGLETVALRYFNVFGPRQHPESQYAAVIPKFMESALKNNPLEVHWDGKQSRDFTYIDNVVQANLLAATAKGAAGEFFNIASGKSISLLYVIGVLEKIIGRKLERKHTPRRSGDVRKTWANISKARKILRFNPSIQFAEGLRYSWDWFLKANS